MGYCMYNSSNDCCVASASLTLFFRTNSTWQQDGVWTLKFPMRNVIRKVVCSLRVLYASRSIVK